MPKRAPIPTHDLTDVEVAWAAGFLEGEGTFTRWKRARLGYAMARVGQTETEPLERLRAMFGGTIGVQREPMEPIDGAIRSRKRLYYWQISGVAAERMIRYVLPYLCQRRKEQALKALTPSVTGEENDR